MPNDRKRPLGAVSVAMASVPAGVGLARKRRQFRKPLPVWCIIRIAGGARDRVQRFWRTKQPSDCRCRMTSNPESYIPAGIGRSASRGGRPAS
jgi:hypothetical protein